jgi:hypothetical protein
MAAFDSSSVNSSIGVSPEQPQLEESMAAFAIGASGACCSNTTSKIGLAGADSTLPVGWATVSVACAGLATNTIDAKSAGQASKISLVLFISHHSKFWSVLGE